MKITEPQNSRTAEQHSRNYSIDSLKFLCAVFVVMIHLQLAKIGPIGFGRLLSCAVPCFFMTSGYLLFAKEGMAARCKKGAIRITKLFLTIWTIWFACNLIFYFDDFNFWECFSLRELFFISVRRKFSKRLNPRIYAV